MEAICTISQYLFSLELIFNRIKEAGFEIIQMKEMLLLKEDAEKVYFKIVHKNFYNSVLEVLAE